MARKTSAQALAKWQAGTQTGGQYYQQGVQNATGWASNTVAALPAMQAGLAQAFSSGHTERRIQATGDQGWKSKTLAKAGNWQQGVQNGAAAYQAGYARLSSMLDAGDAAIAGNPRGGYAQNRQRMLDYIDAVHQAAVQQKATG